jgi:tripartite-type tricarboxylate transporter receptor subunit TctC
MKRFLLALAAPAAPLVAAAQAYPPARSTSSSRSRRRPTDVSAAARPALGDTFGQTVVVENKAAPPATSASMRSRRRRRRHTVGISPAGNIAVNPTLFPNLPYKAADLAPVTMLATVDNVLVVNAESVPAKSVKELLDLAAKKPGTLTYASPGAGSQAHLAGALLELSTGVQLMHVPYRGIAPAVNDLVGGQVSMMFAPLQTALPFVKSGKLRALGVASQKRSPLLPELPTIAEQGVPKFEAVSWYALMVPAGTPADVIEKLSAATMRFLALPDTRAKLAAQGMDPGGGSPQDLAATVRAESTRWSEVVKKQNIAGMNMDLVSGALSLGDRNDCTAAARPCESTPRRAAHPRQRRRRAARRGRRCAGLRRQHRLRQARRHAHRQRRPGGAAQPHPLAQRRRRRRARRAGRPADPRPQGGESRARPLGRSRGGGRCALAVHNAGLVPFVPSQGSVGASGDLAARSPDARLIGEGEFVVDGERRPRATCCGAALARCARGEGGLNHQRHAGLDRAPPCPLHVRAGARSGARRRRSHGRRGAAATARSIRASTSCAAGQQIDVARYYRACSRQRDPPLAPAGRRPGPGSVQPALPAAVVGACLDQLRHAALVLVREANAVTDNPLVFAGEGGAENISGGNCTAHRSPPTRWRSVAEVGAIGTPHRHADRRRRLAPAAVSLR